MIEEPYLYLFLYTFVSYTYPLGINEIFMYKKLNI